MLPRAEVACAPRGIALRTTRTATTTRSSRRRRGESAILIFLSMVEPFSRDTGGRRLADWNGVFVFPPTAMDDAGRELDLRCYRDHLSWLVEAGVHGVVPLGSTGEFAYLSGEERREVIGATVEEVAGRVPVIAGVSAIATRDAVAYAREAEELGADAVLVLVQSYFGLSEDEIVRHFVSIREATELAIFIYNKDRKSVV